MVLATDARERRADFVTFARQAPRFRWPCAAHTKTRICHFVQPAKWCSAGKIFCCWKLIVGHAARALPLACNMAMRFCILGSGSSGNAALLVTEGARVLVDAGFSARKLVSLLAAVGETLERIDAIFLTH